MRILIYISVLHISLHLGILMTKTLKPETHNNLHLTLLFRVFSQMVQINTDYLETVDADEWWKCLERAGVDQAQVWFSLDPVKVFTG